MHILISIFTFSLVGMMCMIGYKIILLRKRDIIEIDHPQHSLEQHVGIFMRTHTKHYAKKSFLWTKTILFPVLTLLVKRIIKTIIFTVAYLRMRVYDFVSSMRKENPRRNGATSFFLKQITEHKKNTRNGEKEV